MQTLPLKNILIVESFNDSAFIRLLLKDLELFPETDTEVIDLHKFPDPDNSDKILRGKTAIGGKLKSFKGDWLTREKYREVQRLGIILDFDKESLEQNLERVNQAIRGAFGEQPKLATENEFVKIVVAEGGVNIELRAACFFTNDSAGNGNLDTLLYEIRQHPESLVPYADCLKNWQTCVNESDSKLKVSQDLFSKMWVSNFLRAKDRDQPKNQRVSGDFEAKQHELIENFGSEMFDLKHAFLTSLRTFLSSFKSA